MKNLASPPPVICSARLLWSAVIDSSVTYTDAIYLYVGDIHLGLKRLGPVDCLAICQNYADPGEFFLLFCNSSWESQGIAVLRSVEDAKKKAERGYAGIGAKWKQSNATQQEIDEFIRNEYGFDPNTEWWKDDL
jgi:hypothetical protein